MALPKKIEIRIIGKTVFTTISRKSYKINMEKEAKDKLKANIEKFNNKPSDYWLNRITKAFEPGVNVEKIKAKAITKVSKLKVDKLEKAIAVEEEVKKVIDTPKVVYKDVEKAKEIAPQSNAGYGRRGEY